MYRMNEDGKLVQVHRTKIDGVLYPVDDAPGDVEMDRIDIDVLRGVPGSATECMDAQCIKRNKKKFGHPVLNVSVSKTRVYILVSPDKAVRYTISERESKLIERHDREGIGEPGRLVLRAPTGTERTGARPQYRHGASGGGHSRSSGKFAKGFPKGAERRMRVALEGQREAQVQGRRG